MQRKTLKIHPDDNLEVALTDLQQGTVVKCSDQEITLIDTVPGKHKFSLKHFAPGDEIIMFGVLVGKAVVDIPPGSLITTKNITHASDSYRLKERRISWNVPNVDEW